MVAQNNVICKKPTKVESFLTYIFELYEIREIMLKEN